VRGPNIKPFPQGKPLADDIRGETLIKAQDNITTDHIMPSNAKLLPYRSNIPYLSDYCLAPTDPTFAARAKEKGGGIIVAGSNYGQGSSREHAALVPLYLGIKAVIAKSFARIHRDNLINSGILPLEFEKEADYDRINSGDVLEINDAKKQVMSGRVQVRNVTQGYTFTTLLPLSDRQTRYILAGGALNSLKESN
jgi:aconitate hydratase